VICEEADVPMLQDETHTETHLERSSPLTLQPPTPPDTEVQRKRMLIALGILVVALVAVVLKDWDFWFPPATEVEEAAVRRIKRIPFPASSAPATPVREHKPAKSTSAPATEEPPFSATTTQRAALPPLQVEVVAGNQHISIPPRSDAIHLDLGSGASAPAPSAPATASIAVAKTGERVQLSQLTAQNVTVSVPPNYPLLARQMKVQGAVSLQALISREGSIQELQILSGPAILAAAAREAVKQWHFKPYYQNGQPVETEARITVNFTISTN
jgi:periplasmic protein TonB